jgi:hypothetical protein
LLRDADGRPAAVSIRIHDAAGRLWREIPLHGGYGVRWDGLDARGRRAPNGVYFLSTGGAAHGRVVRMR